MSILSGTKLISWNRTTQQNGVKTAEDNSSDIETSQPKGGRKPSKLGMQKRNAQQDDVGAASTEPHKKIVPVHQSRISDRPAKVGEKDSSLKIKIELDLEVEVEIYARIKGDITIGLM